MYNNFLPNSTYMCHNQHVFLRVLSRGKDKAEVKIYDNYNFEFTTNLKIHEARGTEYIKTEILGVYLLFEARHVIRDEEEW